MVHMASPGHTNEHRGSGSFVPCVLLMIRTGERDTAELRELLSAFGFTRQVDGLAEALGQLEHDTLVSAHPGGTATGDADGSRRWQLTVSGEEWVAGRWSVLAEPARLVSRFPQRCPGLDQAGCADVTGASTRTEDARAHEWHGVSQG